MEMLDAAKLIIKERRALLPVVESEEKPLLKGVCFPLGYFMNIDPKKVPKKQIGEIMSTKVISASPDESHHQGLGSDD